MFSRTIFIILISISTAYSSYEKAVDNFGRGTLQLSGHRRSIIELINDEYYFSIIPWVKDYLLISKGNLDSDFEYSLDKLLSVTGVKIFESLPEEILNKSKSGNIRYILAKRLLTRGQHQDALNQINKISSNHPAYPFISNLKATILSFMGNHKEAEFIFNDCVRYSNKLSGRLKSSGQNNQLMANKDYCQAGLARVNFASKDFNRSELSYLDIPKDSFVWPEILFEEAWNSYYLKNYNRTLGKLVSYKAPVFDFVFKPEVEVLKALTYLKMCLYEDAKLTVDNFYSSYATSAKQLRTFLISKGKDNNYYYQLMSDHETLRPSPLPIVDSILKSIRKDAAFIEMKGSIAMSLAEYNRLSKQKSSTLRTKLMNNIKVVVDEYRKTLGAYVRSGLVSKYAELYSSFQEMSYIKLEVLAQRKEKLYRSEEISGKKRGDVNYIERNDKQYFWTFNGEFWADELGDYVFALRSEC